MTTRLTQFQKDVLETIKDEQGLAGLDRVAYMLMTSKSAVQRAATTLNKLDLITIEVWAGQWSYRIRSDA